MNTRQFTKILLVNCLLFIALNGLLYWSPVKNLLNQRQTALLISLGFYAIQFATIYFLLGKQALWLTQPFQGKQILKALVAMVVVEGITVGLITSLTTDSQPINLSNQVVSFLPVFVLNSLPGALVEEWLFRYLPFRFGQHVKYSYQPILLCLGALVLFTVLHIPAYILQYNLALSELGRVFVMGLFFLTVYLLTQNLFFTALFHALSNKPLYFVESPYYWLYFYVSVFIVSTLWAVSNRRSQGNSIVS